MAFRLLTLVFLLAACTPRANLIEDRRGSDLGTVYTVFVATDRTFDPVNGFTAERGEDLLFGQIDIAVPPDRKTGTITYPTRGTADPSTEFVMTGARPFGGDGDMKRALRDALAKLPPKDREILIYVHGFNNNFADSVLRQAQMRHDFGVSGVLLNFAWPSAANPLLYAYDRDSALYSRDGLEKTIRIARASGARNVVVAAHSMGSFLTMETLRQMAVAEPGSVARIVDEVFFVSPDIDVDLFRAQASRIGELPDPFIIMSSSRDAALRLSARLTGQQNRLGSVDDAAALAELDVTLLDVTALSRGGEHFAGASSPALIRILSQAAAVDVSFDADASVRAGLLPGTALTIQNATQVVLSR